MHGFCLAFGAVEVAIISSAQGTEVQIKVMAALRGARPQQNMSPVTSSLAPSAGYIGKKTLKMNKA